MFCSLRDRRCLSKSLPKTRCRRASDLISAGAALAAGWHYPIDLVRFLKSAATRDILVSMTRVKKQNPPGRWPLQDAKARFSELVRRVHSDGPQHVTVRGRDEVVVVGAEEFRRLKGDRTGAALIAALQESPGRDIDIEPRRERLPVRDVKL
jgi:prevent-host-death family protein